MYNNYPTNFGSYGNRPNYNNQRGGFLFPFVLGGLTGGLLAPAFYPRPYYNNYYPYYPYPYYRYY